MVGIRFILVRIAQNEFFWFLLKPFVRFASFLLTEHNRKKDGQELVIPALFPCLEMISALFY